MKRIIFLLTFLGFIVNVYASNPAAVQQLLNLPINERFKARTDLAFQGNWKGLQLNDLEIQQILIGWYLLEDDGSSHNYASLLMGREWSDEKQGASLLKPLAEKSKVTKYDLLLMDKYQIEGFENALRSSAEQSSVKPINELESVGRIALALSCKYGNDSYCTKLITVVEGKYGLRAKYLDELQYAENSNSIISYLEGYLDTDKTLIPQDGEKEGFPLKNLVARTLKKIDPDFPMQDKKYFTEEDMDEIAMFYKARGTKSKKNDKKIITAKEGMILGEEKKEFKKSNQDNLTSEEFDNYIWLSTLGTAAILMFLLIIVVIRKKVKSDA